MLKLDNIESNSGLEQLHEFIDIFNDYGIHISINSDSVHTIVMSYEKIVQMSFGLDYLNGIYYIKSNNYNLYSMTLSNTYNKFFIACFDNKFRFEFSVLLGSGNRVMQVIKMLDLDALDENHIELSADNAYKIAECIVKNS